MTLSNPWKGPEWIREAMKETGALLEGHFLLSSGLHSGNYMQCAMLLRMPEYAARAGKELAALLKPLKPEVVVAPALGGLIIGHEVARALEVPFLFCERQEGIMTLRRFPHPGKVRFVAVEDVVTTGGSVKEVGEVIASGGASWVGTATIADRSGGKAQEVFSSGLHSLVQTSFPVYTPEECPLCAQGLKAMKPGSRK